MNIHAQKLGEIGGASISDAKRAASQANWKLALEVIRSKPKTGVMLNCQICGAEFYVPPYRAKTARTCSPPCRQKFNARQNKGDKQRFRGAGKSYVKLGGKHYHRSVAEKKLGRKLIPGEVVHHIDGNKRNNAPENLEITIQSEHIMHHWPDMMKQRKVKAGY